MTDVKGNLPASRRAARYRARAAQARAKSRLLRRHDTRVNFLHLAALLDDLAWEAEQDPGYGLKDTEPQNKSRAPDRISYSE